MNLEEVVIPLSRLQRAFLIVSLEYDSGSRCFHLGKWQWALAVPAACIFLGLIWTAASETVASRNLIGVIRNANVWMEAMLSIIYGAHNTYAERRLGTGLLRDLLTFNDEILASNDDDDANNSATEQEAQRGTKSRQRNRQKWKRLNLSRRKVRTMVKKAIVFCSVTNLVGLLQWVFLSENVLDGLKHVLIEVPNLLDNVLITKWCVYLFVLSEYNKILLEDINRLVEMVAFDKRKFHEIRCRYSRLYFIYRELVETFSTFLIFFVVCQYLRLLWNMYLLTDNMILGRQFEFHTVYKVLVQIVSFCFLVIPCLWIRRSANDIGCACSGLYQTDGNKEVLNFQFQILFQDYNMRPHGAFELNGSLITSVFSTLLVYLVLLIQIARL